MQSNKNDQPVSNPTFYQNILPMFSQYDMVMMANYFNLHDYESLKKWGARIILALQPNSDPKMAALGWSQMQQVHVMPEVPGPWPASWVKTFQNWVDTGCPEGTPPLVNNPTVDPSQLASFIALSQALTGVDDFGPNGNNLANIYYNRMLKRPANLGNANDALVNVIAAWNADPSGINTIVKNFTICSDIINIWYNATTNWDADGKPVPVPYYGTPAFNQYKDGLVWKVSLCHPMGYAPEVNPNYWQMPPTPDGQYTGLFDKNY